MADVVEIDAATQEVIERTFTERELERRAQDAAEAEAAAAAAAAAMTEKDALRVSALGKLMALGLSEAEAKEIAGI